MTAPGIRRFIKEVYAQVPLKRPLFELMRRTVRLPRRFTSHLGFRGPFTVRIDRSHQFRLEHWGYMLENDLFWNGFGNGYEGTSLQIWRRFSPHANVILDVGANTGVYALAARSVNPSATVIALEPVDRVFRRLQRNIDLNGGNITVEKLAASDTTGAAILHDLPTEHELTASLDHSMAEWCGSTVEYPVPTKRLDELLSGAGLRTVDLLKIDVELAEPQVLRGLGDYLPKCKPTLLIEILTERVATQVNHIIRGLGYSVFRVVEQHGLVRTDRIEAIEFQERNYLLAQENVVEKTNICDFVVH
jgi:FkbM family methyltransferase